MTFYKLTFVGLYITIMSMPITAVGYIVYDNLTFVSWWFLMGSVITVIGAVGAIIREEN